MQYTEEQRREIAQKLCRGIAAGLSVAKCCKLEGMPSKDTIFQWLMDDAELSDQYARARRARADARSDRIDDIKERVELGEIGHNEARVIIDAEKWQAGKENAERYGDRLQLDADVSLKMTDDQLETRLAHLLGKAGTASSARGEGETEGQA